MPGRDRPVIAACSFCLKPNTEAGTLVAGHGVYICDGCAELSRQLIAGKPASVPQLAAWDQMTDVDQVLATLPRVAAAAAQVEQTLAGWVRRARALGATWAKIGEALGMTRQSAWERFSGEEQPAAMNSRPPRPVGRGSRLGGAALRESSTTPGGAARTGTGELVGVISAIVRSRTVVR